MPSRHADHQTARTGNPGAVLQLGLVWAAGRRMGVAADEVIRMVRLPERPSAAELEGGDWPLEVIDLGHELFGQADGERTADGRPSVPNDPAARTTNENALLLVRTRTGQRAVIVDRVEEMIALPLGRIHALPELIVSTLRNPMAWGVAVLGEAELVVLVELGG